MPVSEHRKATQKEYYNKNREKILEQHKIYRQVNKEKIILSKRKYYNKNKAGINLKKAEYRKTYRDKIRKKGREYYNKTKKRYNNDSAFCIKKRLRARIGRALNKYTKTGKIISCSQYGISYKAIIEHLKPFPMERHLFHIDHIKPLISFNLEDPEEIKKAFAPDNHQWLRIEENLSKGAKIEEQSRLF